MPTTSNQNPRIHASATSQIVTLPPVPELFDPNFLDVLVPVVPHAPTPKEETTEITSTTLDVLQSTAHQKLTANNAPAFNSTLVATLDAYVGLRTGISGEKVDCYLENAWAEDPNLTLRMIWSTRSIHDGKGEKVLFHRAFGWLFENHPRTAITNLHYLVDPVCRGSDQKGNQKKGASHGYWKDLLDILALATVDELMPQVPVKRRSNFLCNYYDGKSRPAFKSNQEQEEWSRAQRVERSRHAHDRLVRKLLDKRYLTLYVAVARLFAAQLAKEANTMDKIAALPPDADKDARIALMADLTLASKWAPTPGCSHDRVTNISSAICLLLYEAQVSFPIVPKIPIFIAASMPASDMHLLRYHYQKHILTRGRRYTSIPESRMSSNRWSEINYTRVPSVCMNKNKEKFFMHDEERFLDYLQDVGSGKKKISGATLLPHVLAIQAVELYCQQSATNNDTERSLADALHKRQRQLAEAQMMVVDSQWATLVSRLRESGQLDNSMAVCDVSGSMGDIEWTSMGKSPFDVAPLWPSIALSLLVARLAKPPFNDAFITFSATPELITIEPEYRHISLGATIDGMYNTNFGQNTDFNAVFLKLILPLATKHNVPKDQMIKRIFVFTDMQFDEANPINSTSEVATDSGDPVLKDAETEVKVEGAFETSEGDEPEDAIMKDEEERDASAAAAWKTNYDVITEAYARAGYDVPELVFWDLSNPGDGFEITVPVTGKREGTALLSGYSQSLLKVFMEVKEEEGWEVIDKGGESKSEGMTPVDWMKKALGRRSYDGLVVVD